MTEYTIGEPVEIIDTFDRRGRTVCTGNVERVTKTLVVVRNELGNVSKFRRSDDNMVGYSWPHLTHAVRKIN